MAAQGFLKELYFPFPFLVILLYLFQISRDIHRRQLTNGDTSHAPPAAALIPAHSTVEKAERESRETEMSLKEITSSLSVSFPLTRAGRLFHDTFLLLTPTHSRLSIQIRSVCVCVMLLRMELPSSAEHISNQLDTVCRIIRLQS